MTFHKAETLFASARFPARGKPLANNTRLYKLDRDTYYVQLHRTPVVYIHRSGNYTLYTGGWETVTTKRRINDYSPAHVFQRDFEWFIWDRITGREHDFFSGVMVDENGQLLNHRNYPEPIAR